MLFETAIIVIYYRGTVWSLAPGKDDCGSYFGGPDCHVIDSPLNLENAVIHHIASVSIHKFGVAGYAFGFTLPLYYGVCHEGCVLEYRKTAIRTVEITAMAPSDANEGYPYPGYPAVLPYYRLGVRTVSPYKPGELQARIANTGWTVREECLYTIAMDHPFIGHCLFEPGADVEIVFEYDPQEGKCRVINQSR